MDPPHSSIACRAHQQQCLSRDVGDFVIKRADGLFAYQLAVVVDDADQAITHVVRGADLLASTPRQIWLQQQLQLSTPSYLHHPIAIDAKGEKLSKQTERGAVAGGSAASTHDRLAVSRPTRAAGASRDRRGVLAVGASRMESTRAASGRDAAGATSRSARYNCDFAGARCAPSLRVRPCRTPSVRFESP